MDDQDKTGGSQDKIDDNQDKIGDEQAKTDRTISKPDNPRDATRASVDRIFPVRSVVSSNPAPRNADGSRTDRQQRLPSVSIDRNAGRKSATSASTGSGRQDSEQEHVTAPTAAQQVLVGEESSTASGAPQATDDVDPLMTARFQYVMDEGGHAIITGREGEPPQKCEEEPIHAPGAVQSYGMLLVLEPLSDEMLLVRVVSENSRQFLGYTPRELFALDSFTRIMANDRALTLLDHVDFARDDIGNGVEVNGPDVFALSVRRPDGDEVQLWCALHQVPHSPQLVICEFELQDDEKNPPRPEGDVADERADTLNSQPTPEELEASTRSLSRPLRRLRSSRRRTAAAATVDVFDVLSQVQEQMGGARTLDQLLRIIVGIFKDLTGFHRVMMYQFSRDWHGRVVSELVDTSKTADIYMGLNFPASDIPRQARDLYKLNKVRVLYDRDQQTARLVCRSVDDLERPLDLTHAYLRAMSPIHLKYLANMAVRSSMSVSINTFGELWGLISCHSYGSRGMRITFPLRKLCRLMGDAASRNIERLSYASRLQARKLINTVPTEQNPSGYIIASSEDLLELFNADFGMLSIRNEAKILGRPTHSQEALAMLEYLRMRRLTHVVASQNIHEDFPDLEYAPGFTLISGVLLVPLSNGGEDFIVFCRPSQLREVKWAGNPYHKNIKDGTRAFLEPRKSFKTWSETVVDKCRDWTEEEIETAAVLCLVYGKFIQVWRQKEAAVQSSQLTKLLLANSAHEVRTPLNAIINYIEIALEGHLDAESRDYLVKSHEASKSLVYVINDLLDLTKTESSRNLVKDDVFDLRETLTDATDMFKRDAQRKGLVFDVTTQPDLPSRVIGDRLCVRQTITNLTANAIQNTVKGSVKIEMYVASWENDNVQVEISVADTGCGFSSDHLDALFRELEQVQSEEGQDSTLLEDMSDVSSSLRKISRVLGLGLAVVGRIVKNVNGQLRLTSQEGRGSTFIVSFPFLLPDGRWSSAQVNLSSPTGFPDSLKPPAAPVSEGKAVTLIQAQKPKEADRTDSSTLSRKSSRDDGCRSRSSTGSNRPACNSISMQRSSSARGEADRLIEAIKQSDALQSELGSSPKSRSLGTASPSKMSQISGAGEDRDGSRRRVYSQTSPPSTMELRAKWASEPGTATFERQMMPIRPVKVPDPIPYPTTDQQLKELPAAKKPALSMLEQKSNDKRHMRVLVAEDDPINSRIIKTRMEKLGHELTLTANGEECSDTYSKAPDDYDIILMDIQMPIMDGYLSTKRIREFEKCNPEQVQRTQNLLDGAVPIIAVSASLREGERQYYVDVGFDGWILKPIPFARLSEIMAGTFDEAMKRKNLYVPGEWERGGWFMETPAPT
ncbi:hypothetical protein K470DRAFT_259574 [Piedraia hortae CBS 480.64]|uniref:Cyanobacterial phytochrome B n=1 Tax=Piedraia hortae CBS 480.64 TaxID=1314780 RepID=A0A6A7BVZ9_9PEZI|nr:hypothetical protein K470DRAFT_259574 [Piedraia hortae CBS 480.64]